MKLPLLALATAAALVGPASAQIPALGPGVPAFTVRPGYHIDLVADGLDEVRFLEFGDKDTLYVSQPRAGSIITLRQSGGTWKKVAAFTTGKPTVHGMHWHEGWLWFTQSGVVWKARDTNGDGKADEEIKITDDLPSGGGHWWRPILVAKDGFYTSIGDSGNINDETKTDRQKIWKFKLDGTGRTLFAAGLRNTEKLRLRPGTDEVWGADHGSDWWGKPLGDKRGNQPFTDRLPPCEFNHYVQDGFYGHPFIVGNSLPRLEFKDRPDFLELEAKTIPPAWCLGAHWAPNGWTFVTGDKLGLKGDAVIACHGSWNSSKRVGYRVERVVFDGVTGTVVGALPLVSLLGPRGEVLGRPCDVVEAPDGSLLFSDDDKKRIYRISAQ
jgi:glucose/arabinose dehydrogenase